MKVTCIPSGSLGVNTYLAGDEASGKAFMVDPGGQNKETVNWLNNNGFTLEYIVLTHGHGDHIGGVDYYRNLFPDVKLVAGEKEKDLLASPSLNASYEICGRAVSLTADLWVHDGDTLAVGGMTLKFFHTPGHTPGGICILVDDVLFSGDTLFYRSIGRTDFPGGSYEQIKKAIHNKLFVLPEKTKVLPGHMGPTTIEEEKRSNPFV